MKPLWLSALLSVAMIPTTSWAEGTTQHAHEREAIETKEQPLQLGLLLQLQGNWEVEDEEGASLLLRRVRPKMSAKLLDGGLKVATQWSITPRAVEVLDVFADVRATSWAHVRVGQYKIPFTRYRMNSVSNLVLVDWPRLVKFLGAERQIGVTVHNGWKGGDGWRYHVGVFSGANARASQGIGPSILYERPYVSPSNLLNPKAPRVHVHPEMVAHLSWSSQDMDVVHGEDYHGGGLRGSLGASATLDAGAVPGVDSRARMSVETMFKLYGWTWVSAGYLSVEELVEAQGQEIGLVGGLSEISYRWPSLGAIAFSATTLHVTDALQRDIARSRAVTGSTTPVLRNEQSGTLGVMFDLWGESLRLRLDAEMTRRETQAVEHVAQVRAQFQAKL